MNNNLLIIGAGGHGRVAADVAVKTGGWDRICFLDDGVSPGCSGGLEIAGSAKDFHKYLDDFEMFVAVGNNKIREEIHLEIASSGARVATLVHPSAVTGEKVCIGAGTVLAANAVVNCGSVLGQGCIVNTGATVDHDSMLGDFTHISPGAHTGGCVRTGRRTWVGIGAAIINSVQIADDVVIGAGGVVVSGIGEPGTYAGVPAERIG